MYRKKGHYKKILDSATKCEHKAPANSGTAGQSIPDTLMRYIISASLGVSEFELSPDTRDLIGGATKYLVLIHSPGSAIDDGAARAYGAYVAAYPKFHELRLDEEAVRRAYEDEGCRRTTQELEEVILHVAQIVGKILLERFNFLVHQSLLPREY